MSRNRSRRHTSRRASRTTRHEPGPRLDPGLILHAGRQPAEQLGCELVLREYYE
ncbi:hypothetical protein [Streptosporangium sp. NPDC020145]|uniref:hypothetical protein n=1 Tax=Streptosporangium sp. NPDC020145 TaxID=3154694 RepID=UPI003423358D